MKKKLTLVIEESVIYQAKQLARKQQLSVSEMVENYFVEQTKDSSWKPEKGSALEKLVGVARPPKEDMTDDELLYQILNEKYG